MAGGWTQGSRAGLVARGEKESEWWENVEMAVDHRFLVLTLLTCWTGPGFGGMFISIHGLRSSDVISNPPTSGCDNPEGLQTLHNVPWGQHCPPGRGWESLCTLAFFQISCPGDAPVKKGCMVIVKHGWTMLTETGSSVGTLRALWHQDAL